MDGIHDLGGRHGFGPIDRHGEDEGFHEAWEGRGHVVLAEHADQPRHEQRPADELVSELHRRGPADPPYVDPMSELQVDLLRRWRQTDRKDEELYRALLATAHGIAEGLQNTG